jgi:hypothetical protein
MEIECLRRESGNDGRRAEGEWKKKRADVDEMD